MIPTLRRRMRDWVWRSGRLTHALLRGGCLNT